MIGWTGAEILQAHGHQGSRVALLGHSMGGRIAMQSMPQKNGHLKGWRYTHRCTSFSASKCWTEACIFDKFRPSVVDPLAIYHPWRIRMYAMIMVSHLPSIYPSYVSINLPYDWIRHGSYITNIPGIHGCAQMVPRYAADYPEDLSLLVIEDMVSRFGVGWKAGWCKNPCHWNPRCSMVLEKNGTYIYPKNMTLM